MNKLFSGINIFYKKDKYKVSYIKPKKQCKNCHFIIKNSINVKWPFKCICYRRKNDATIKISKDDYNSKKFNWNELESCQICRGEFGYLDG